MQRNRAALRGTAKRLTFAEHVDGCIARERSEAASGLGSLFGREEKIQRGAARIHVPVR